MCVIFFFFQAEDGIRDYKVTGVQTCALPILLLNEGIGSYTTDLDWTGGTAAPVASRQQAPADLLPRIYSSGLHSNAKNLSRSEEHTSELQSPCNLVCRLLLEKKKKSQ